MSNSFFNASMQAQATREQAQATREAAAAHLRYAESIRAENAERLAKCIEEYANLDESSLFRKSDKELANFQAEYPPESPQYTLAQNEWNRRLLARQIKESRFSAIIGLIGIVVGALLGWLLAAYPAPRLEKNQVEKARALNNTSEVIRQPTDGVPKPSR